MIAWLISKLGIPQIAVEIIAIGLMVSIVFYSGYHTRSLVIEAAAYSNLKKSDDKQFSHDLKVEKARAIIDEMNDKLNQDVETAIVKTPVPNCNIGDDRVLLINRAATRK